MGLRKLPKRLLTIAEAAKTAGLTAKETERLVKEGILDAQIVAGRPYIDRKDADALRIGVLIRNTVPRSTKS